MSEILLVDDDLELCELLSEYLVMEGFTLSTVHDGLSGVEAVNTNNFKLVLLDVTLPKLNGFEVLKRIRQNTKVPVLMLTARGEEVDRIIGLEIGADDYLPKPFNHRELIARMKAILRRTDSSLPPEENVQTLNIDDLSINLLNREVLLTGKVLEMTATEFLVIKTLVEKAGTLIGRDELTKIALGRRLMEYDRAIDMHVSNVRKKTGPKPDGSPRIKTVRGSGYFYITD
ncbi:MAG: response regulator [SAR324 cluster bacterium]|nr:response regulator [SAR324 cluster bacterium]